ncbi:hypothetical protein BC835DRAFT_1308345 [Cytidiella melzeri]|nr:hypothetical protein BC835DRAFT_1308345 [Cytidiella melzeri]
MSSIFSEKADVPTIEAQQHLLQSQLKTLCLLISNLPFTLPAGLPDGPLRKYFTDVDIDPDEGPWYSVDRAWTRVFQGTEEQQLALITSGPDGIGLVQHFSEWIAQQPGLAKYDGHYLTASKVYRVNELIIRVVCNYRGDQSVHNGLFLQKLV